MPKGREDPVVCLLHMCVHVYVCVPVCLWVGGGVHMGGNCARQWTEANTQLEPDFPGPPPLATWLPPQGVSQTLFFPQQSLSHLIIMEKECPFLRFLCFHWSKNLKRAGPCPSSAGPGRSECWAAECGPAD